MPLTRRTILSAIGVALPIGLGARAGASATPAGKPLVLRFRPFEEALREAFASHDPSSWIDEIGSDPAIPYRRVEVGHSDQVRSGVQGCHNDRPFAGFPTGHLRIIRTGSEPGPVRQGVRLYVTTLDVALVRDLPHAAPGRPLDFASLLPAPIFS
jgi:hypothetical protein